MKTNFPFVAITYLCLTIPITLVACNQGDANTNTIDGGNSANTQSYSTSASPSGINPNAGLTAANDGNLYGTATNGGYYNCGTVFKVSPDGTRTDIYSFTGVSDDGCHPYATLVQANDGNLYGTTYYGGKSGKGTVFKITTTGAETTIYSFYGSGDGAYPRAALIVGNDGYLYGTTQGGGVNNMGTIYKISITGTENILYSFSGKDGSTPSSGVIEDSNNNLYGTNGNGGVNGIGTVFKFSLVNKKITTYSFLGTTAGHSDGAEPAGGLIMANDGNLYGTTAFGGSSNSGTIFRIAPTINSTTESVIYSFKNSSDGYGPVAGLIQTLDGTIYGTAEYGGSNNVGTIFKLSANSIFSPIYSFESGTDGAYPSTMTLVHNIHEKDYLYGTTASGGINNNGTIFKVDLNPEEMIHSFENGVDGIYPFASLMQASDNNIYGITSKGGINDSGTVYKLTSSGVESVIYAFAGGTKDGDSPYGGLIEAPDGYLYGTTAFGGLIGPDGAGNGTIYKISKDGAESVIYFFSGNTPDGGHPGGKLLLGNDGNFYGATTFSIHGPKQGTIFKTSSTGVTTTFYTFAVSNDGNSPNGSLINNNNSLYGTTKFGGSNNDGIVFSLSSSGIESIIYSFTGINGSNPSAGLIMAKDGNFYGTTQYGGSKNDGVVFSINKSGIESVIYTFTGNDGRLPVTALIQAADGNLYGTTYYGGNSDIGEVFKVTPAGILSVIYSFSGSDGSNPQSDLLEANDGYIYGTTAEGGAYGYGTIFRIKEKVESIVAAF